MQKVITEKQDLRFLKWSHVRTSSGTAGTFLKSQSIVSGEKIYYKLSNFDSEKGIVGHECVNSGWKTYIDTMLVVDYLILNRDRHGANIEVLRNARKKTIRIAPLFDHGPSFLYSCYNEQEIAKFDVLEDKPCQNFIGSRPTYDNLSLIDKSETAFATMLKPVDKEVLLADLEMVLSKVHLDKIWDMLWQRWCEYEKLCKDLNEWEAPLLFQDNTAALVRLEKLEEKYKDIKYILQSRDLLESVQVGAGGYYISFNESIEIEALDARGAGELLPLKASDFYGFVQKNIVDTTNACFMIGCSRQNLSYLVKENKLTPILQETKENLYTKGEISRIKSE